MSSAVWELPWPSIPLSRSSIGSPNAPPSGLLQPKSELRNRMQPWRKPLRACLSGMLAASLMLSLTACATRAFPTPPAEYLRVCPKPVLVEQSQGALAQHDMDVMGALDRCNDDKAAIRDWVAESKKHMKRAR